MSARRRQAALRREVFARDQGVCSACGLDTEALRSAYAAAKAQVYGAWRYERDAACMGMGGTPVLIAIAHKHRGEIRAIDDRLRALGFKPGCSMWEFHHGTPVADGGDCTLENAVTLCYPHHRVASAEYAGVRSRRPSKWIPRRAA